LSGRLDKNNQTVARKGLTKTIESAGMPVLLDVPNLVYAQFPQYIPWSLFRRVRPGQFQPLKHAVLTDYLYTRIHFSTATSIFCNQ
jgi:hypothetical protein